MTCSLFNSTPYAGKNTINPSVEEILDKIDKCNSSDIILLPNDKNAIMSCEIAIQKSKKNVSLIKTLSVSEGLTSMIVFNNEVDISSNIESMQEYIKDICFTSISISSRSGSMNNTIYKEGDYITISDGDIVLSESDLFDSITKTIEFMNPVTDSYLTIYWGNIEDTNVVEKKLSSHYENIDIEFQKGGQQNFVASLVLE